MLDIERLNKVGLDYISLEVSRGRNSIYCIDSNIEDAINTQEPNEKYSIDIWIDIIGIKTDSDEEVKVGKLKGKYFESKIVMEDYSFYDVCDCEGADLEPLASTIIDSDGNIKESICGFDENLMYIDRIFIDEKYRGVGIASFVIESLNELLEHTVNLNPDVYILLPKPQEKDKNGNMNNVEDEKQKDIDTQKLLKLYKKLGFKKIRNSDYMIKKYENGAL